MHGAGWAVCAVEGGAAGGGAVESVGLNYLQKNLAPVVDEVVVHAGGAGAGYSGAGRRTRRCR